MAAMPQQMSDSQEKSDDLIAELAKLMASNAQGADSKAEPAPKLSATSETPAPSPAPLRIPGMNNPAAPAAQAAAPAVGPVAAPADAAPAPEAKPAAAPAIRIPGMNQPAASAPHPVDPIVSPPVAAPVPQAKTEPKPGPSFDFGKPPGAAPVLHPEPLANWQTREVTKPAPAPTPAATPSEPVLSVPPKSAPVEAKPQAPIVAPEAKPQAPHNPAPMTRVEPVAHAPAPLVGPTAPVAKSPAAPSNAPAGDGFDFDFGFGKEPPATSGNAPAHDPIADLIAAELDAAEAQAPKAAEPPKPVLAPPPVPVRSFANPNQAPVLIAKPQGARPVPAPTPAPAQAAKPLPAPAAAQRSENERFAVAPVFGLSGKTTPQPAPAQRAEPDPMDEIESLIGEAVRVELSPSEKAPSVMLAPPPPAKPTVPPLSQTFAPRRADISKDRRDREPPMESAEAAILAAAAATGAQVDRVEAEERRQSAEDHRPVKRMKVKPPKSRAPSGGLRQYIGMAVAGTLLLAAGLGLYWVLNMGRGDPSQAPVLTAEAAGPTKQPAPVVASAEPAEPASTGLFDQMQGNQTPVPTETLVSRDETEGAAPTEVARVVGTEDDTEGGLANRKVRTVTVRPDGTIVPGDEAVAGNEVLPVDRPNVPDIPGGEPEPSALLASVEAGSPDAAAAEVNPDAIAAAISGETPVTAEVDPNAVSALLANAPEATAGDVTIDPTKVAPLPMPRPSDRTAMVGGANRAVELQPAIEAITPTTATTEVAATAPAPQVTSNAGGAYSQLSSQPTEGDAQSSLNNLQARYGSLFGSNSLQIRQVDLGAKGTWYRVVLPTSSFQEATQVCASVKSNGGDCIPNNG